MSDQVDNDARKRGILWARPGGGDVEDIKVTSAAAGHRQTRKGNQEVQATRPEPGVLTQKDLARVIEALTGVHSQEMRPSAEPPNPHLSRSGAAVNHPTLP
jgi:hypothetical protein